MMTASAADAAKFFKKVYLDVLTAPAPATAFEQRLEQAAEYVRQNAIGVAAAADRFQTVAQGADLVRVLGTDWVQERIARALGPPTQNGHHVDIENEPVEGYSHDAGPGAKSPADIAVEAAIMARWERQDREREGLPPDPPPPRGPEDGLNIVATPAEPRPVEAATLITPAQWPDEAPPDIEWLAHHRIPRGDVTTIHGDGGAGKTDIALRLAANVARGATDWLGHDITAGPVVFISAEEPEREVRRRLWLHGERDGYAVGSVSDLHFWLPDDVADGTLATPDRHGIMRPTPLFDGIKAAIAQVAPVLVVVDNVAATFAGNQNDRVMVRTFVNL